MEVRELKGSVYDLPDIECGSLLKELDREVGRGVIERADVIIVEGYLVKNKHDTLRSTRAIIVDTFCMDKYVVLEGGKRLSGFIPDMLYMTQDLMEKVINQVDTPVCNAEEMYDRLQEAIKPYMWDTCGYSQESNSFDIVLAVQEIIENIERHAPTKEVYVCWDNDGSVLGIATTVDKAQEICKNPGQAYMKIATNVAEYLNVDSTELCIHNVNGMFLTYNEAVKHGVIFYSAKKASAKSEELYNFYPMYNKEEVKQELAKKTLDGRVTDNLAATSLWCAITSALTRKYKTLTEEDSSKVLDELIRLANELDKADFLHREDIEEVL